MNRTRSGQEQSLLEKADRVFPGGVLGRHWIDDEHAVVFSHGRGAHLYDLSGREYIDYTCGGGALLLGYDHPEIAEAIRHQLTQASQFISILNVPAIEYASELLEVIPCGEQIRFANSGSEGTFYALRLARAFTGRDKILKFEGAYHGHHDYAMWSYSPKRPANFPEPVPDTAGMPKAIAQNVLIAPYNDVETMTRIVRQHSGDLAAIIVEPVQRLLSPLPGFLEGLRKLSRELGIVLIFDETVTGFRLACGGAQERYGVLPDLAVYSKTLGGGLPLAAIAGRRDIMRLCDPRRRGTDPQAVYQSGTLNGNPVTTAAGRAFLRAVRRPGVYAPFLARAESLKAGLREIIGRRGLKAQVVGEGPLWHLVFTDQRTWDYRTSLAGDRKRLMAFHHGLLEEGIFVRPGGGHYFSMMHTDTDVAATLVAAERVLDRIE